MDELIRNVIQWAADRNIIEGSTAIKQLDKTSEEFNELQRALGQLEILYASADRGLHVNDDLEVVVFEMSARSDGGTNTFMNGSAYSYLYYGEPLSMGRRMALEIKKGIDDNRLEEIIT